MRWRSHDPTESAKRQVKEAAEPQLSLLDKMREEQRRVDAEIERYIRLIQSEAKRV